MLSHVFGAVDKTSSSFSAHGKIGNFTIIIIINQQLLQVAQHMQQTLSQLIDVMNSGLIHTLLNDRPSDIIHQIYRSGEFGGQMSGATKSAVVRHSSSILCHVHDGHLLKMK